MRLPFSGKCVAICTHDLAFSLCCCLNKPLSSSVLELLCTYLWYICNEFQYDYMALCRNFAFLPDGPILDHLHFHTFRLLSSLRCLEYLGLT